jgi:glycosyltransferase involved in cell wall biosynthesis
MISVIIPLFNKEDYIAETINSILNQTYKDFEVIVVNDGSTDNSLQVLEKYKDERLKIFSIENAGVSVARNIGVEKTKYDYIAFLDADDYWDNNFLSEMVQLIDDHPGEKVFASGRTSIFNQKLIVYNNPFLPKKNSIEKVDYIKVISQFLPPVNSSNSVFFKKTLVDAGLFKPGQKQHEDHDLWLRICQKNEVVYSNIPLSYYRKDIKNSGSKSGIRYFDFHEYLSTILQTKNSIDQDRSRYFKKYYNKFILLTFIKYQSKFSKQETFKLLKIIKKIVSRNVFMLIKIINSIPSGLTYNFLSKLKK